MPLAPGTVLGPYEVVSLLGAGGMGEVFRARDSRLHRDVALKILPAHVADDPDRRSRFERESRAIAALSHPNVLSVFDVGVAGSITYAVTELLEGESLREHLGRGALPVRKGIDIAVQMARGLSAAHDKGIVHRDVKPENVFVLDDGRVKVVDFGLARTAADASADTAAGTDPGVVMGTVGYMAPEQVRAQSVDPRTDLFALGVVLHEMLSGRRLFHRETAAESMTAILRDDPPELVGTRAEISPALDRIVRHCLEKNPAERFQTARDVAFALESLSGSLSSRPSEPVPRARVAAGRGRWLWPAAAAAATFLVMSGVLVWDRMHRDVSLPRYVMKTFEPQTMFSGRFLPDGSTFAYTRLADSEARIFLIRPGQSTPEPVGDAGSLLLSISRSGELAVLVDAVADMGGTFGTLARLTIGGAPRRLRERVRYADWAPDGNSLAIVHDVEGRARIEYPIGTVLYETTGFIGVVRVSPDGERVAFNDYASRSDGRGWIKAVDRAGRVVTLSGELTGHYGLAWWPDGASVVFSGSTGTSDQPSTVRSVYSVQASGRALPDLVLDAPGGLHVNDVNARGELLAARSDIRSGIMVQLPSAPGERSLSWMSGSWAPALSRDGGVMAFQWEGPGGASEILLRNTDGSPALRVGQGTLLGLSPDGARVLALAGPPRELVVYPTGAGEPIALNRGPIDSYVPMGAWFPAGDRVLTCGSERSRPPRCYAQPLSGPPRAITPEGFIGAALSADGRQLLAHDSAGAWHVVDLTTGIVRAAAGLQPADTVAGWSSDGRAAFATRVPQVPARLERVDLHTGVRTLVRVLAPPDRTGVNVIVPTSIIDDARGYAYFYRRDVATWYVVRGISLGR
jgi:serine/threonine protein kinase/Tol biopolymer transport system component